MRLVCPYFVFSRTIHGISAVHISLENLKNILGTLTDLKKKFSNDLLSKSLVLLAYHQETQILETLTIVNFAFLNFINSSFHYFGNNYLGSSFSS